jgi:hypothetical protein
MQKISAETLPTQYSEQAAEALKLASFTAIASVRGETQDFQAGVDSGIEQLQVLCESIVGDEIYLSGRLHDKNGNSRHPDGPDAEEDNLHVIVNHAIVATVDDNKHSRELRDQSPHLVIGATVVGSDETVTARLIGQPHGVDVRLDPDSDPIPL